MKLQKKFLRMLLILGLGIFFSTENALAETKPRLALFITGLSGTHATEVNFQKAVEDLRAFLLLNGYQPEQLVRIADEKGLDLPEKLWAVEKLATKQNLAKYLDEVAQKDTVFENVFIFISGHANGRDEEAMFHLPGDDMAYKDLMAGIQNIRARQMMMVVAASQGTAWVENLSSPERIIVVGNGLREFDSMPMLFLRTFPELLRKFPRSEGELSETSEASVTLLEAFTESQRRVLHWYRENGLHTTEMAILDADGDKKAETLLRPEAMKKIFKDPGKTVVEASSDPDVAPTEEFPMDLTLPDAVKAGEIKFITESEGEREP
jgi:hypothetical protein